MFKEQLFRPDSLLNRPMVGMPFVDSLVRGFLVPADHSHRDAVVGTDRAQVPGRTIRAAIDIIEEEAHLPMTVSSLAARTHLSVRFRDYPGVSPMTYLRQVRLRRAHEALLESDSSSATVASIAYHWGFTNLGRFAAAHADRYGEAPSEALRRKPIRAPRSLR